jgi:competence protein ComFA
MSLPFGEKIAVDRVAQAFQHRGDIPEGRALLEHELDLILPGGWRDAMQLLLLEGKARVLPGVNDEKRQCNRCGSKQLQVRPCASCNRACAYCEACLSMGRSRACTALFYISPGNNPPLFNPSQASVLHWKGQLTPPQQVAAQQATALMDRQNQRFLVWAV